MCLVINNLSGGGSEKVFSMLSSELAKDLKYDVTLILLTKGEIIYLLDPKVKVIQLNKSLILFSLCTLIKSLKKIRPHIVFSTLTYVNTLVGGIHFLLKKDYRLVARESTIPSINNNSRFKNLIQKIAYIRFDKIICQSDAMAFDLKIKFNIPEAKLIVINNPVDIPDLVNVEETEDTPVLLIVSMLRKEKGIQRILQSLSRVKIPYKCKIYGNGPELRNLKKCVSQLKLDSKVAFEGLCNDREKLNSAFREASITLFGSFYEGFPNVVLESLAAGTPVLAFPCQGGLEEILNSDVGVIAPNEEDFTRLINEKIWTTFEPEKLREIVLKRFGTQNILHHYENLIKEQCADSQEL